MQRDLDDIDNLRLRIFKAPEGLDSEVQRYIQFIASRNKLYSTLYDYPEEIQFQQFLETYFAIDPPEERQKCLQAIIKDEIRDKKNVAEVLLGLAKELGDESNADNIVVLLADLSKELVEAGIFIDHIDELRELSDNTDIASEIDIEELIQDGLRADLTTRFACLRGEPEHAIPTSFEQLKEELEENYDLTTKFDFVKFSGVDTEVINYVDLICQRNLVHKYAEEQNLDGLVESYADVEDDECEDVFLDKDRLNILQAVQQDLGSQERVRV